MKEATSKSPTAGLARFITDLRYERIPSEVISHVKICILDTLGCALYGSTLPWGKIVVQFVKECCAGRGALIWGDGAEVPSPNAPLANGTLVHSFELDDIYRGGSLHTGAVTLPAADAMLSQVDQASGKDYLAAVVAGSRRVAAWVGRTVSSSCGAVFIPLALRGHLLRVPLLWHLFNCVLTEQVFLRLRRPVAGHFDQCAT